MDSKTPLPIEIQGYGQFVYEKEGYPCFLTAFMNTQSPPCIMERIGEQLLSNRDTRKRLRQQLAEKLRQPYFEDESNRILYDLLEEGMLRSISYEQPSKSLEGFEIFLQGDDSLGLESVELLGRLLYYDIFLITPEGEVLPDSWKSAHSKHSILLVYNPVTKLFYSGGLRELPKSTRKVFHANASVLDTLR